MIRRHQVLSVLCYVVVAGQLFGAEPGVPARGVSDAPASTEAASTSSASARPVTAEEIQQLRQRIAEQQEQIKLLQNSVDDQRAFVESALKNVSAPPTTPSASAMTVSATPNSTLNGGVKVVPAINVTGPYNVAAASRAARQTGGETASPLSISIGSATITPLGFVDFTFFSRSTNVGSGLGTNFAGIPYNAGSSAPQSRLSESNFTAQNSRIGFRVDSTVMNAKVLGYFEADFLGNQPTNVFVTSNADTFRMRNVFVDVQKGGLEVLGGQDWSLFTPNRRGLSPLPSDIFYTQNMDTNYQVGLIWSRQAQFRLIAHPTKDVAFGVSLENPQQYIAGSNGSAAATLPASFAANTALSNQFNNGTNNYGVPNLHPDIIFKAAYDGHVGEKILHVEAGGLVRSFKDSFPTAFTSTGAIASTSRFTNNTLTAASGEANANLEFVKNVRLVANTFFGAGGGRYIFGQGPDVIVRANGTLSAVHSYSTVDGFEATFHKNTLISMLYGGAYFGRDVSTDINATRSLIGYGYRGAPNGQNRTIQEATFDIVQTLWKSPNYGALQLIGQYSYLWRDPWYVPTGQGQYAKTNLFYLDLRYTIP